MIRYADTHTVNQIFSDNLREVVDLYYPKESKIFGRAEHFTIDPTHPDTAGLVLWTAECRKYI
jgi:hypothetical protein